VQQITDLLSRDTITFEYLWALFPKRQIVYRKDNGSRRAFEVARTEYIYNKHDITIGTTKHERINGATSFRVYCRSFLFDGTNFGPTSSFKSIYSFDGVQRISSLDIFPLGYHMNPNLGNEYSLRGKRILDVQDMAYRDYNGPITTISAYGTGISNT
jgi:hypothetical protein